MNNYNITIQQRTENFAVRVIKAYEVSETQYWIKIIIISQLVSEQKFSMMQQELIEIIKILTATINKLKLK